MYSQIVKSVTALFACSACSDVINESKYLILKRYDYDVDGVERERGMKWLWYMIL